MPVRSVTFTNRDATLGASYPVSLSAYDGPLDLLLQLIERRELDISEVSLCAVTDQYLRTLETLERIDPVVVADFVAIASRLLYIKSNRLLPRPREDEDEEEDAGEALVRQLIEYRRFRQAAEDLKTRADGAYRVHVRALVKPVLEGRKPKPDLTDVDIDRLQSVLSSVLKRMPVDPPAAHVTPYRVTVSEQIDHVREFVRRIHETANGRGRVRVLFSAVLGSAYTRTEVIVTFLAILELIKQQELAVEQDTTFGDIYLLPLRVGGEVPEAEQT